MAQEFESCSEAEIWISESLTRLQSRSQLRFDGDQTICFEDGLFKWLMAGGLSSLPCGKGDKKKSHLFRDSIYIEFLKLIKLYSQKASQRLPRGWNKNRNEVQRGTKKLGVIVCDNSRTTSTIPKTHQTVHFKRANLRYVNCAPIN